MSKFDINSFIGTPDVMKNAVHNIDIDKLVPYKNHCFKLYEGERLDDMVRSVQNYGIMIPIIVRNIPDSDKYEILSGHNRVNAARIVRKKNVPAIIKENLPDEFASVYVVESNAAGVQRTQNFRAGFCCGNDIQKVERFSSSQGNRKRTFRT